MTKLELESKFILTDYTTVIQSPPSDTHFDYTVKKEAVAGTSRNYK